MLAGGSPASLNAVRVLSDDVYQVVGSVRAQHTVSWNLIVLRRSAAWLGADTSAVGAFPWEKMSWLQYMPSAFVSGDVVVDSQTSTSRTCAGITITTGASGCRSQ